MHTALDAWQRFRHARGQDGVGGRGLLYRHSPAHVDQIWCDVRRVYLEVWAEREGSRKKSLEEVVEDLKAAEASHAVQRECRREQWERTQMRREEHAQREDERKMFAAKRADILWQKGERRSKCAGSYEISGQ